MEEIFRTQQILGSLPMIEIVPRGLEAPNPIKDPPSFSWLAILRRDITGNLCEKSGCEGLRTVGKKDEGLIERERI